MLDTPRANVKPRDPIRQFSRGVNNFAVEGLSPPTGESTRLADVLTPENLNFEIDSPTFHNLDSCNIKDMNGASPHFSDKKSKGRKSSSNLSEAKRKLSSPGESSYTQLRSPTSRTPKHSYSRHSSQSEDDQPSGSIRYLGESATGSGKKKVTAVNQSKITPIKERNEKIVFDPSTEKSGSGVSMGLMLLGLVVAGAAGGGAVYMSSNRGVSTDWKKIKQDFRDDVDQIKTHFPTQSGSSMKILKSALSSGLQDEPDHPGSVILMYPPAARLTARCLVNSLSASLHKAFKKSRLSETSAKIEDWEINSVSLPTDESGHDLFYQEVVGRLADHRVVTILDVDRLHHHTAHVLHGVMDTTGSDHKQAAVLMTLEDVEADQHDSNTLCNHDEKAENILRKKWASIGKDKVDALVSRVTVNVVGIQAEPGIVDSCPGIPDSS